MLSELESYFLRQQEPLQSCLLAVKDIILKHHPLITSEWKYKLPFFCYNGKMLCYIHFHKKYKQPYLGFYDIDSPDLLVEGRARVRIFLFDPNEDLPVQKINKFLTDSIRKLTSQGTDK
jgi:hypothetical protein